MKRAALSVGDASGGVGCDGRLGGQRRRHVLHVRLRVRLKETDLLCLPVAPYQISGVS